MRRNQNLCTLLVGLEHGVAAVENSVAGPQKIKQNDHVIQQFLFWVHTRKN